MRYLGVDSWDYNDYDIASAIRNVFVKHPLPDLILREKREISFTINKAFPENGKIIYHGQIPWGAWNKRNHIWVVIEEKKTRDAIFDAVSSVFEKRAIHKAEFEATKKLKIALIKKEFEENNLDFINDIEIYF